ncbi:C40 family peptidase [Actinomycetospora sp. DW7H6]|uniref:C40 family peptidase n=1 Tax=Actinomycetospora lemnae TaxID=3019891 RepID=A0ABT5SS12_9PSEU|nr:C40 family peptidase [Actinomycetospora sp. DW7H6]MDD7965638.1 C40 family peptidase [Actinomycetospora sp. DW7H6]
MRLLLPVAALAGFLVVVMAAGLLVVGQFVPGGGEDGSDGTTCEAGTGAPAGDVPQTSAELDEVQRRTAATIIGVAKGMAVPPRGWVVALATAMQESQMGTVGMDVAVDHDSLGVFQQRPSQGWGTPEQVRDPVYATKTFLDRLLQVPGWETMPVTEAAQIVQRSAFPNAYAKWETLANSLVADLAGVTGAIRECVPADEAGPGPAEALPPGVARTAIEFATAETGKPYVWGATGPSSYDCSGLMLRAYERAGIVLPRVSRDQYKAGAHVPVEQAQPGDLLFWAYDESDPDTIHHVAMYLGNGQMMEAQQTGVPLGTRAVTWGEAELLPLATRPGTGSDRA